MSYTVRDQTNAIDGKPEYIVVDGNGLKAPAPHGGPFSTPEEALEHCALLCQMSIEDWFALYSERIRKEQTQGIGRVLHIAPDGRWIQELGRNAFTVHPPTDFDLKLGRSVTVHKAGGITLTDRGTTPYKGR